VTELKGLLERNADTAELRTGVEKLATVSQKMGQAMYAQAEQPTADSGAGTGDGQHSAPQDDEGVVDAEIVDEDRDRKGGAA
jgi:molecular chaperone DnaK